jgi:hypothetical protein
MNSRLLQQMSQICLQSYHVIICKDEYSKSFISSAILGLKVNKTDTVYICWDILSCNLLVERAMLCRDEVVYVNNAVAAVSSTRYRLQRSYNPLSET